MDKVTEKLLNKLGFVDDGFGNWDIHQHGHGVSPPKIVREALKNFIPKEAVIELLEGLKLSRYYLAKGKDEEAKATIRKHNFALSRAIKEIKKL